MIPVRQSTAVELPIGPVFDADGVAVTDCVVGDFKIKKTTGNFAALNGSATLAYVSAGMYDLVLTTSDVDTVGDCTVAIDDTTNACAPLRMKVVEEAVYDAIFAASANGIPDTLLGYIQLMLRSDAGIATDRATELGHINADEGSGAGSYDNTAAPSVALTTTSRDAVADAVWDEVCSGHTTNGTYGKAFSGATSVYLASGIAGTINTLDALDTAQDSQHGTTQSAVGALNNLSAAQVNAEVDTALSDWGKTGFSLASTGLNAIVPADPSAIPVLGTSNIVVWIGYFGAWTVNEVNSDADSVDLRNSADNADLANHATSDNGTTFSNGAAS